METNDGTDGTDSGEDLIQMFSQIKEAFKQEVKEKEYFRQKLQFIEDNEEWSKRYAIQLKEQLDQLIILIDSQQKELNQYKRFEVTNNELTDQIKHLKKSLAETNQTNQDLNLTIGSKDIFLSQTKREFDLFKTKGDENITEIKEFYENKIKSLYKEFDINYQKLQKQNDEKIIEIRANCMRSVDKTKEEYETQLYRKDVELKELKEKTSDLRLELEAMKMSKFETIKNGSKYPRIGPKSKIPNQSSSEPKQRLKIQCLDSDEELNQSIVHSVSKRKKLLKTSDPYLDYMSDD